jgi:hypothetical protein
MLMIPTHTLSILMQKVPLYGRMAGWFRGCNNISGNKLRNGVIPLGQRNLSQLRLIPRQEIHFNRFYSIFKREKYEWYGV